MPLADIVEKIITSFIKSKDDVELDAAFNLHVHPDFKFDVNGRQTDFDGWKARWRFLNSVTKNRKLDVRVKMGTDEGPMDAFINMGGVKVSFSFAS